jgi:lipoprotein
MKKLALLLLSLTLTACEYSNQELVGNRIAPICYEGVTYLTYRSDVEQRSGIAVQLDNKGNIVPCKIIQNEKGDKTYWRLD